MKIFIVTSGYKPDSPVIVQAFKTKRAAEKTAIKRRAFWPCVAVVEKEESENIIDSVFSNERDENK